MPTWTTTRKKLYSCNGSQTVFPFTFPIGSASDIVVKLRTDATGVVTTLELTSEYTVTNASGNWDSGGIVTTISTYESGKTLLIKRVTPKTQTKDYLEGDDFPAESHEEGIDKLTRIVQELLEEIDRCIKIPDTDAESLSTEMPTSVERALHWLGFDASGEPTVYNPIRIYAILDFMVTFIESANATAALAALGIPADTIHLVDGTDEPIFENGWNNRLGGYAECGFYKDIDDWTLLQGRIEGGPVNTVVFTLPVGKRPDKIVTFSVHAEHSCHVEINSDGEVRVVA